MGFQSQDGHVGFRTQVTKGSYLDPGAGGVFMRTRSGALGGTRELLIPDPEIGGGRDVPDAYLGPVAFTGEYEFYGRLEALATLFYGAFGTKAAPVDLGAAAAFQHVITPTDGDLPWLSVEENIAGDYDGFQYTDAKVNTLHLEADAQGYLMGTAGLIALTQNAVGASTTADPDFDISPMIVGSNITVSWEGNQLPSKAFSFDITNNLEDDDFRLGSLFLGDATEKRRELTASTTVRPDDSDLWRQAMYGDASLSSAGGLVTKSGLIIACQTYEVLTGVIVSSIEIEATKAALRPFEVTPSGDDVLEHDVEIQFLRPDPGDPVATVTIVNGASSIV